ncbi:MAG: type II toxin-antitoxin system HicA family toxin [Syntrophothermus sp.]
MSLLGQFEKLLEKVRNNPKTVRFEELDKILRRNGFRCRQPHGGSSHYVYIKDATTLVVPFQKPYIKEIYVRQVIEHIGDLVPEGEENNDR